MGRFPFPGNDNEGNCNVSANVAIGHKFKLIRNTYLDGFFLLLLQGHICSFFCFMDMGLFTWNQQGHDDDCL